MHENIRENRSINLMQNVKTVIEKCSSTWMHWR